MDEYGQEIAEMTTDKNTDVLALLDATIQYFGLKSQIVDIIF